MLSSYLGKEDSSLWTKHVLRRFAWDKVLVAAICSITPPNVGKIQNQAWNFVVLQWVKANKVFCSPFGKVVIHFRPKTQRDKCSVTWYNLKFKFFNFCDHAAPFFSLCGVGEGAGSEERAWRLLWPSVVHVHHQKGRFSDFTPVHNLASVRKVSSV